ncbi:MAG: hypothetical protein KVP17_003027 [Porospora cf. gigantea B]|uniref:uncharacterized protein n=1 Tax=Porospora cf. gigantea B TaxID=2853592 RepID=UPI0035718E2D|nr:MAG: hypothetical protein KVP17_003027 [Porospora cf. gigantea B]
MKSSRGAQGSRRRSEKPIVQSPSVPLPQRDLVDVLTPDIVQEGDFVTTENLTTLVCIVSKSSEQTFLSTYESWSDLVCPRSAMKFDGVGDKENNVAYRVVVFKRALSTFLEAARKSKVHCREYSHNPTAFDTKEAERSTVEAEIVKAESFLLRVILAAFSELFISSVHLKVMKIFVECVLRFGIPPKFNAFVLKPVNAGKEAKLHKTLSQMLTSDFESHQPQDGEDEAYYPYVFLSFIPFLQYIQK